MDEMSAQRSLGKGVLAGVVAGLVATVARGIASRVYAPRDRRQTEAPEMEAGISSQYANEDTGATKGVFTTEDWVFGMAVGAAYGALAEFYPSATADGGKTFGLALMTLTNDRALPVSEDFDQEGRSGVGDEEATSHLVFGTVAEQVRSYVRQVL